MAVVVAGLEERDRGQGSAGRWEMNWSELYWVSLRSAGLVMIDAEYSIGSQMSQYSESARPVRWRRSPRRTISS